jgi:transcriptional regulator with PAS, ATPase and Fis domain
MNDLNWAEGLNVAITVSDNEGKIVYMNNKSASVFSKYGGRELMGKNLKDCHNPESWEKIASILISEASNCYTIEKSGKKKLIYQTPWYEKGKLSGLVELSVEIPFTMEHFVRT